MPLLSEVKWVVTRERAFSVVSPQLQNHHSGKALLGTFSMVISAPGDDLPVHQGLSKAFRTYFKAEFISRLSFPSF